MVFAAKEYQAKSGDVFFFDNNIWMFLYSPIGNYAKDKQRVYSRLFEDILRMKCQIWINALVLSEFVNANLRGEYEIWKRKPENGFANKYKEHFLKSDAFKSAFEGIKAAIRLILKSTTKGNDDFNAVNLETVFSEMESCDFNDAYYLEYGRIKRFKIVTDDGDLYKTNRLNIDIITYRP